MSTQTCAAPTSTGEGRARLVTGPLALVFLAGFGVLASFELLLSVMPMYVSGAGSAGAGLVTGVLLLGTVAAEAGSAYLIARLGYRPALAAGSVLLGVPALAMLTRIPLVLVAATTLIRGFGFGLTTVVIGALVAEMLPPDRRGEGLGLYGIVDGIPQVLALPAGVWLAGHCGYPLVAVLAAGFALAPIAVVPLLPATPDAATPDAATPDAATPDAATPDAEAGDIGMLAALRGHGQLIPGMIFATTTVAGGVIVSFLPLTRGVSANVAATGLLAQALTATVTRWWAGKYGDRHGHARLMAPALIIATAGLAMMVLPLSPVMVIAGMSLFGAGFGIMQNASLALMMDRMPASGLGTASALWNLAYDAGYGAGPAAFGLTAGHTGYAAGFGLTAAVMLVALPAAIRQKNHR
ncbi:MAG TPA: MFS transporter [Streptosporangiaceae bacterium]